MAAKTAVKYTVHPGVAHWQKMTGNMAANTGRDLKAWLALVGKQKLADASAINAWLKEHSELSGPYRMLVADAATEGDGWISAESYLGAAPGYVENMFTGAKAGLRPLYEELLGLALKLGKDVKVSPCQTYVPLYRAHVFAHLKPTTRSRLDLGLALGTQQAKGRLIDTGGYAKKDRITHRIAIAAAADIDAETRQWLALAYERDL